MKKFFNFERLNLGKLLFFQKPIIKSEALKVDVIVNCNSSKRSEGPVPFFPLLHKCFLYIDYISTKHKNHYHVKFSSVLNFETTSYKLAKIFN